MKTSSDQRPDPDALLKAIHKKEEEAAQARLKIFFGMCAGAGKTYEMLKAAHEAQSHGIDVVVGVVETHGRPETQALLDGLSLIPRRRVEYKGTVLEEMDLDAILSRKPQLALVDELAHTNAPGSRHTKRHKDVEELLNHGIDVYTTLNVQHLESRADTVAQITGSIVRETVPDSILERANEIEVVDISPEEILQRLAEGKIYTPERSRLAVENFFRKGNLTALREMALRLTAERVDSQLRDYMRVKQIAGPWKSGQRLVVAISASPHSVHLIRWARRVAFTQGTSWVAVHVETSTPRNEAEKSQLAKNVKLAQELGAEVISTADEDVGEALIRVARQENCTQILIGKPRGHFFRRSSGLLTELIRKSGDLDVYVIGGDAREDRAKRRWSFPELHSDIVPYLISATAVLLVTLLCFPFASYIGYETVALILLFTVAVLPLKVGIGPVLLAAGLSALAWDFFFVSPLFTFSIGRLEDVLMLLMYFFIAIVSGVLTTRARAQEKAVRLREERAMALYALSRDLALAGSKDAVASATVSNVTRFFDTDVVLCLGQTDGDIFTAPHPASSFAIDEKEFAVAAWVYWNEKKAGRFTDTLPAAAATYYPISGPRYPLGVLGIKLHKPNPLTLDQETLIENFVRQVASAIERETLNEITKKSMVIEQSEKLYKTLFNSISHEMRTPLSTILGATESLLDGQVGGRVEVRRELTSEIHQAAERLNRLVENLLDMTRLESGLIQPKLDWCDMNDLISSTIRKMEKELAGHSVTVAVASDLPLVKIDFALVEQVLINLLLNAALYTPAGGSIRIDAVQERSECIITVTDTGPGVPVGEEERIFDKFYRVPGSRAGGTGLGLSIARGFVQAHRGSIKAERCKEGGSRFVVRLPIEMLPQHREQV